MIQVEPHILYFAVEEAMRHSEIQPAVQALMRELIRVAPELPDAVRRKLWLQIERNTRALYLRPWNQAWRVVMDALKTKEAARA